jgi:hypothetical protein
LIKCGHRRSIETIIYNFFFLDLNLYCLISSPELSKQCRKWPDRTPTNFFLPGVRVWSKKMEKDSVEERGGNKMLDGVVNERQEEEGVSLGRLERRALAGP